MRNPPVTLVLLLAACHPALPSAHASLGDLAITDAYAHEPVIQESGAAYLRIHNKGEVPDTLRQATSPEAAGVMFHGAGMSHLEMVAIPPGGDVVFEPGKSHLMLENLTFMPKRGDSLTLVLDFVRAGELTLKVPVRALTE